MGLECVDVSQKAMLVFGSVYLVFLLFSIFFGISGALSSWRGFYLGDHCSEFVYLEGVGLEDV